MKKDRIKEKSINSPLSDLKIGYFDKLKDLKSSMGNPVSLILSKETAFPCCNQRPSKESVVIVLEYMMAIYLM